MARATFRKSDVKRAIEPAMELGLTVTGYEIGLDGQLIVHTAAAGDTPADASLGAWVKRHGKDASPRR